MFLYELPYKHKNPTGCDTFMVDLENNFLARSNKMDRTHVIQRIIDKKQAKKYLEIGVSDGENFFKIKAEKKVAVDPHFTFYLYLGRIADFFKSLFINNGKRSIVDYHGTTSDSYFTTLNNSSNQDFDVVFIDGLHTHSQSLKDVLNSLVRLRENGVIIMHDCLPPHSAASLPVHPKSRSEALNIPGWDGQWCGDVWKTICYLRSNRDDLNVFVLDCDYGLGVITRGIPVNSLNLTDSELSKLSYEDLIQNKKNLLNLQDESYLLEFLKTM